MNILIKKIFNFLTFDNPWQIYFIPSSPIEFLFILNTINSWLFYKIFLIDYEPENPINQLANEFT